jgi:NAD+ diphosphatase
VNEPPPPFRPLLQPPDDGARAVAWFGFRGDRLLVRLEQENAHLPDWETLAALGAAEEAGHYLGRLGDVDYYAVDLGEQVEPGEGLGLEGLRALFGRLADPHFAVAGRAAQILEWDRTHRFCGRCGEPTVRAAAERAKQCPRCGLLSFPRLSPAVIMRVERGDQILLGRNRGFVSGVYSVLAGFVEPGESLEEAVAREVAEEAGVQIADIRYFGSQSWPFPHQMMIGFTARHAGGEIQIDPQELEDAQWFSRDNLPRLPSKMSISRRLIDDWLQRGAR